MLVDTAGSKSGTGQEAEKETEGETEKEGGERVLGYILGASDTRKFEESAEQTWYPPLRAKYPLEPSTSTSPSSSPSSSSSPSEKPQPERKEADTRYVKLLHAPESAPQACIDFSPAHMHIDLLPEVQRRGWGKRLVDVAVRYMRGLYYDADGNVVAKADQSGSEGEGEGEGGKRLEGVWLGLDPKNMSARRFYEKLGFGEIEGAPENCMGMKFEHWKDV